MADQAEVPAPRPQPLYLSSLPTPSGEIASRHLTANQAHNSLFQVLVNPRNADQAALVPAPGADGRLLNSLADSVLRVFEASRLPGADDKFLTVEAPTLLERSGDNWQVVRQGRVGFSPTAPGPVQAFDSKPAVAPAPRAPIQAPPVPREQPQLTTGGTGPAGAAVAPTGSARVAAGARPEAAADRAERGPEAGKAPRADGLRDEAVAREGADQQSAAAVAAAYPVAPGPVPAPAQQSSAAALQVRWKQQGDAVAPLLEMRAYIDQLKDSGVAVGPMRFEKGADGKWIGSFGVRYDPDGPGLIRLEGILQGLKRLGNGVEVVEQPGQVGARRQRLGVESQDQATDLGYSVREAFGVKQWDALSAHLNQVPRQALTDPEHAQQAAGAARVQQVARQQGKTSEQVIQEGKSLLDIDTSGNPVSAFLKNFYEHLTGAPKTRQTLEVDYERTQRDLLARLTKLAGKADAGDPVGEGPHPGGGGATAAAASPAPAPPFTEADIPHKVLASMGLTVAGLRTHGQLEKLLSGQKTDLVAMQAGGRDGQEAVRSEAKLVLYREANGSATLKMELPKKQLVIPNEVGGQPFTPEQRQRLATEGTAGLVRGLRDQEGNSYNGYVGVDKAMNKLVVLPESKVTFKDEIAGVKLSPEQRHDLREGKAIHLAQMSRPDGGKPFDGTAQIHAAKAGVEVRPAPSALTPARAAAQTRGLDSEKNPAPVMDPAGRVTETAAPAPRARGPRP